MKRWILLCLMSVLLLIGQSAFAQQPCGPCPEGAQCLLPECPLPESEIPETPFIRLWNRSDVDFEDVHFQILEQTEQIRLIEAGLSTDYIAFETAYTYGWLELTADGKELSMIPIDYVGETPLEPGYYTYALDVQDDTLSLDFLQAVMSVDFEGGMCVYGGCSRTVTVYTAGTVAIQDGSGEHTVETVNEALITTLTEEIAVTDFDEIRSHVFTGTCPIAYDGQELKFTFYTAESVERISNCQYEIDENSDLYGAITDILEKQFT